MVKWKESIPLFSSGAERSAEPRLRFIDRVWVVVHGARGEVSGAITAVLCVAILHGGWDPPLSDSSYLQRITWIGFVHSGRVKKEKDWKKRERRTRAWLLKWSGRTNALLEKEWEKGFCRTEGWDIGTSCGPDWQG